MPKAASLCTVNDLSPSGEPVAVRKTFSFKAPRARHKRDFKTMIRDYTEADTDALIDVWYKASALAHPFLSDAFLKSEADNIRSLYLPNTRTWVATNGGMLIGFIAVIESKPAEVGAIFLDPSYHEQGTGKAMMDVAVKAYGTVELDVFRDNSVGRRFYKRYGFREIGRGFHEPPGQATIRLSYSA